ncbi:integral membrane protein [Moelleriella libera RCEF 2490]|uniref:Integral membrane protein n=1 Tax=Moelleriella libera RCEF 2490 TaxID=1081109 RepID=A0A168ARL6_9HYPO|nr:integral membrane protein [Moelleriella libera RCEF 2490]
MSSNGFIQYNPDLVDEDRGQHILILSVVFSVLIVLSTTLRIILKLWSKMGLGPADYLILISLAFNLAGNMLEVQAVQAGFGRHLQFLPRDQVLTIKRLSQYNILLANIALWAVKISVCCFLLSLVQVAHQRTRWIIFGLIAITTVASTTQGILWGLQARPLEKLWNPDIPGEVSDIKTLVLSIIAFTSETFQSFARVSFFANNCTDLLRSKVVNSITDLFYALSPVYFIGRLRLSLGKRLIIIALTGSGLLVFATSITRVGFDGDFYEPDSTWALYKVYLCTIIERNLAEIVADLPACFALFRTLHKKTVESLSQRQSQQPSMEGSHFRGSKSFGGSDSLGRKHNPLSFDDEIPLQGRVHLPSDDKVIHMQTRIDVESHCVGTEDKEKLASDSTWSMA